MATIKELQAKFSANQSGMEAAFNAIANRLNDIEKASDRAAKNMEKNMSRGMNRIFKTGEGFEKVSSVFKNISNKSAELGTNLTNKITKPAMIAGGALASITIGKGFGRLVEIDNAKAKLDGLGHSSESVQKIMDNALESVKGTSFGLGEAATTASSAVAAGIKPGKELTRYLSLTGDAAAIAGSSMGEMGSIINKVQTSNKAYNGELQQLSERGIPIYQWIAKEAGVTADEVFKMASDGEISSKMFLNAIETNIGGAAKKMGQKSFTASLANMWAAVGRLGASFLDAGGKGGGFFSKMKPLMNDLTTAIDGMEGTAAKWGETLGQVLDKVVNGIKGIVGWYNSLDKNTQKLINSVMQWGAITLVTVGPLLTVFSKFTGIIAGIFGPFGRFLQFLSKFGTAAKSSEGAIAGITKQFPKIGWTLAKLVSPVGLVTLGIVALSTAFIVAYKKSETFRNIVNGALNGIKKTFMTVFDIVKGFFQLFKGNGQDGVITLSKILPPSVVQGLTIFADNVKSIFSVVVSEVKKFGLQIGGQLIKFWNEMKPAIMNGMKNLGTFIQTIGKNINTTYQNMKPNLISLWNLIKTVSTAIVNIIKWMMPVIKTVIRNTWEAVKQIISGALNVIMGVIKVFTGLLTGNFKLMWSGIKQIFIGAFNIIVGLIKSSFVGQIIAVIIRFSANIKRYFINMWNSIKATFMNAVNYIWNGVKNRFTGLMNSIKSIFTSIRNFLVNTWNFIKNKVISIAQTIWNNVRTKFTGLWNSIKSIFTSIRNFVVNLWNGLKNKVTSIAQTIWSNIRNKFNGLWNSVKSIFNKIYNYSRDTWISIKDKITDLANTTKNNVINGFESMYNKATEWVGKIKQFIIDAKDGFFDVAKDLGNSVANGAIKGLNSMIDGVNWLSNKIMDKDLIKNKIAELSTGTGGTNSVKTNSKGQLQQDTLAMVNDKGPGNGKGRNGHQELIRDKDGSLFAPRGRDVILPLRKGMEVINGRDTQNMYGGIPRFSAGSATKKQTNNKRSAFEQGWDVAKATWNAGTDTLAKKGGELAGKGVSKAIEVWDYIENPADLVQLALSKFGVSFDLLKIPKERIVAMRDFLKHGYAGLKKALVKKVAEWFEEAGGYGNVDGSSILKHGISFGYSPNKPLPGYPLSINGGRHFGIDTPHIHEKIQAPTGGIVREQSDFGGGTIAQILSGKVAQYYLHLDRVLKTGRIKQGDTFAQTGNSGHYTSGPHLHTQIEDPAANALTNKNTKDPVAFLNSKGGKSGGGGWLNAVRTALKIANLPVTKKYINAWIKQIETESSGNPNAMGGNDGLADGNAMGLVQVKPGTFKANQGKGMGDIWNPLHNLVAGMNYAKKTYGSRLLGTIGQGNGYADGGIVSMPEIAWLAEGGFSESVISHDPAKRARNKVIWDRTGEMLGFSREEEILENVLEVLKQSRNIQEASRRTQDQIAKKNTNVYMDGKEVAKVVSHRQGQLYRQRMHSLGG